MLLNEDSMETFVDTHRDQLQHLNIPEILFPGLKRQLDASFPKDDGEGHRDRLISSTSNILNDPDLLLPTDYGSLIVLPHLCSWNIIDNPNSGMLDALGDLPDDVLTEIWKGLRRSWGEDTSSSCPSDRSSLLESICDGRTWSRVILFRKANSVFAALPPPPYFPQTTLSHEADAVEADLTGPFPFVYKTSGGRSIDLSLLYLSPGVDVTDGKLPTIDLVPLYTCQSVALRSVRLAALLGSQAPAWCQNRVKKVYEDFVQKMSVVRPQKLDGNGHAGLQPVAEFGEESTTLCRKMLKVYTDTGDPMQLSDPENGLAKDRYVMTDSPEDADIIYSYQSLFAPGKLKQVIDSRSSMGDKPLINQFPFEGAFVQKDHLGREILRQHGVPLPSWAIETYDLDVHLAEFVGAASLAQERGEMPIWIAKPSRGTQSKGHVVTSSIAHILRLMDAEGGGRVVQRYITNPVCVDGRKVDCRCLVLMTSARPGRPTLYMYKTLFFRIANKQHKISTPAEMMDHESVLTATHLFGANQRTSADPLRTLPLDVKTISNLEATYKDLGFEWESKILPDIQKMIRELFSGMTEAFPAMNESSNSRAIYGVDIMFQIGDGCITPKLTEVTFCPSNNTICSSYENDEVIRQNYCSDIFDCLFRGDVSDRIVRIQ